MGQVLVNLAVLVSAVVAVLMLVRQPRSPITWILVVMASAWVVGTIGPALPDPWTVQVPARFGGTVWVLTLPLLAPLVTAFPDGPKGTLGRWLWRYEWFAIGTALVVTAVRPATSGWPFVVTQVLALGLLGAAAVSVAGLVIRWRRSGPVERSRLGVVMVLAAGLVLAYLGGGAALLLVGGPPTEGLTDDLVTAVLAGALPAAVGISLLTGPGAGRPGAPARVTAAVLAAALTTVLGLLTAAIAVDVAGTGEPPLPPLLAAIGVAVLASGPVRAAVLRPVEALLPGARAERAVAEVSSSLRAASTLEEVPSRAVSALAAALDLADVVIEPDSGAPVRAAGEGHDRSVPIPAEGVRRTWPLTAGGERVGTLTLTPRSGSPLPPDHVVMPLLTHLGVALAAVRAGRALATASERLVDAREEERQRLRNDLHDELGPSIAGIRLAVTAASAHLEGGEPWAARELLVRVDAEAARLGGVLRGVLDDLAPHALVGSGFVPALESRVLSFDRPGGLQVSVQVDPDLPPLPLPVEMALYRIAVEAVANTARHADARRCDVRLGIRHSSGRADVVLEVTDDGRGLPPSPRPGIGSASMRQRAAAAGGSVEVRSRPAGGTTVVACLPVAGRLRAPEDSRTPSTPGANTAIDARGSAMPLVAPTVGAGS